jgi:sulfur dioxygenase
LIGSTGTKEAVLIDPVDGHLEDYLELLRRLGLRLKYSIE